MLGEDSEVFIRQFLGKKRGGHLKNFLMTDCQMLTSVVSCKKYQCPQLSRRSDPERFSHSLWRAQLESQSNHTRLPRPQCFPSLTQHRPRPLQPLAGTNPPNFRGMTHFPVMETVQYVTSWHLKPSFLPEEV